MWNLFSVWIKVFLDILVVEGGLYWNYLIFFGIYRGFDLSYYNVGYVCILVCKLVIVICDVIVLKL